MKLHTLTPTIDRLDPLFQSASCQELVRIYSEYYPEFGFDPPWVAYLIIREEQVVGTCSFTGKPQNGKVEIAYWTFEEFEGQGVASFACKSLIDIAHKENPAIQITAKTAPEHNASTKILEREGFSYSGIVQDADIGDAWLWSLTK